MSTWQKTKLFLDPIPTANGSLLTTASVSCITSGPDQVLIVGDDLGAIHFFNAALSEDKKSYVPIPDPNRTFQAHNEAVLFCACSLQSHVLVTIGLEPQTLAFHVKWWYLRKWTDGVPALVVEEVKSTERRVPITPSCLAINRDGSNVAVGLADGHVLLLVQLGNYKKHKYISVDPGAPITGLGFLERDVEFGLYATTSSCVKLYDCERSRSDFRYSEVDLKLKEDSDNKRRGRPKAVGGAKAAVMDFNTNQFYVAHDDAIWIYSTEGRTEENIPLQKVGQVLLHTFSDYLAVIERSTEERCQLSIYHLQEKIQSLPKGDLEGPIVLVGSAWDQLIVFSTKLVSCYGELPDKEQIDEIVKRKLHQTAINVAIRKRKSKEYIASLYLQFGMKRLEKGDYEGAMEKFLHTIGTNVVEPSDIIEIYLKDKYTNFLILYLEGLHEKKVNTNSHTALLLNCYSKSKKYEKIKDFITKADVKGVDVDAAVRVCRMERKYNDALDLAKKIGHHEWYIKILMEDFLRFEEALDYIHTLDFEDAVALFKQFGKEFLTTDSFESIKPKDLVLKAIQFAKELCTDYQKKNPEDNVSNEIRREQIYTKEAQSATYVDKLIVHINSGRQLPRADLHSSDPALLLKFNNQTAEIEHKTQTLNPIFNTDVTFSLKGADREKDVLEIICYDWNEFRDPTFLGQITLHLAECLAITTPKWLPLMPSEKIFGSIPTGDFQVYFTLSAVKPNATRAHAEDFIGIFSKTDSLQDFLEFIDTSKVERKKDQKGQYLTTIYDTLLELYLQSLNTPKALNLINRNLENPENPLLDHNHALLVCNLYQCHDGTLILYKQMGLPNLVIQHCMEHKKYDELYKICSNQSPSSRLWVQALMYFADEPSIDIVKYYLKEVVSHIETSKLLSPVEVLEILQNSKGGHQLDIVKRFLINQFIELQTKSRKEFGKLQEQIEDAVEIKKTLNIYKTEAIKFKGGIEPPSHYYLSIPTNEAGVQGYADDSDITEERRRISKEYEERIKDLKTLNFSNFTSDVESSVKNSKWEGFETMSKYLQKKMFDKGEKGSQFDAQLFSDLGLVPLDKI